MSKTIENFADLITMILSGFCHSDKMESYLWRGMALTRSVYDGSDVPNLVIRHASNASCIEAERRMEHLANRLVDQEAPLIIKHILIDDSIMVYEWSVD